MSFISVAAGQPIRATHVQQFTNWLTAVKVDSAVTVAATSTTEYTMTVRSQDGGTGLAFQALYGSASSPTTIASFAKALITLASPVKVTGTTALSLAQLATAATPGVGFLGLYPKTDGTLAYKVGTSTTESVVAVTATAGSFMVNPMTAAGDVIIGGTTGAATRLAIGTARQVLAANAGTTAPEWVASLQSLMTGQADLVVATSANTPVRLPGGSTMQGLHMVAGMPAWQNDCMTVLSSQADTLYASAANTPARLAKGTAFQTLLMNAGATAPAWGNGPNALVQTAGDVVVGSTVNTLQRIAAGTATQVFIGGTTPAFASVSTDMLAANAASQVKYAAGSGSDPVTTSTTMITLTDMSQTVVTVGGEILAQFSGSFYMATGGSFITIGLSLDGATSVAQRSHTFSAGAAPAEISTFHVWTSVAATTHTVVATWLVAAGTGIAIGVQRGIMVRERKK